MLNEVISGIKNYRLWHLMGTADLRRRFARSKLGNLWLTLTTAITISALGYISSVLFKMNLEEALPHITVSAILWFFLTSFVSEGTGVFIAASSYFVNQKFAFSTVVMALVYRNLITLFHNFITIFLVLFYFKLYPTVNFLYFFPALMLTIISGFLLAYMLGMLCARFRDFTQVIANLLTVAFYVTPVFWKESALPPSAQWVVQYNPFTHFLVIMRDALLSRPPPIDHWMSCLLITFVIIVLSLVTIGRYQKKLIYWL